MTRRPALFAAALLLAPVGTRASEVCRFAGTTDHDGRVEVRTEAADVGEVRRVDVSARLNASMWLFDIQYLMQEISLWQGGTLQSVAVNSRYSVDGRIIRQQWDLFTPGGAVLQGWRVQAKRLADFQRRHPGFVRHWDPASFGQPWVQDYAAAVPERRPDLDLHAAPGLRSSLALAFYWVRWLPLGGETVTVALPGFKRDAQASLAIGAAEPAGGSMLSRRATLHHPALSARRPSTITAWVSEDQHLLQLAFDLHGDAGDGGGVLRAQGCTGLP